MNPSARWLIDHMSFCERQRNEFIKGQWSKPEDREKIVCHFNEMMDNIHIGGEMSEEGNYRKVIEVDISDHGKFIPSPLYVVADGNALHCSYVCGCRHQNVEVMVVICIGSCVNLAITQTCSTAFARAVEMIGIHLYARNLPT